MLPDSEIANRFHMHRTKATAITAVTAYTIMEELLASIKAFPFSLGLDESTTITVEKLMVVMARRFKQISGQVNFVFLCLSEVPDATAQDLFNSLEAVLHEKDLPFTNLVGCATDGASVMRGRHNSVTQ